MSVDKVIWLLLALLPLALVSPSEAADHAASGATGASGAASSAPALPKAPEAGKCPAGAEGELCEAYESDLCLAGATKDECQQKVTASPGWRLWHWFLRDGLKPVLGLATVALGYVCTRLTLKLKELAKRLGDPVTPRTAKRTFITNGVNVLIAGPGGRGKTSIIRALSGSYMAAPSRSTDTAHTYCIVYEVDIEAPADLRDSNPRLLERVYINDYEGQRPEDAVAVAELNEREKLVPATVLLLVVDLFYTPHDTLPARPPQAALDTDRIEENINKFGEEYLRVLLTRPKKLKQIVLFINKLDLLRPLPVKAEEKIKAHYLELIERIVDLGNQKDFMVIVGSASRGDGVTGVNSRDGEAPKTLYEILKKRMVSTKG